MRIPKPGTLVKIVWADIVGGINQPMRKIVPQNCKTVGWVQRVEEDYVVVASSIYQDDVDETIDGCAIPIGCILEIARLR